MTHFVDDGSSDNDSMFNRENGADANAVNHTVMQSSDPDQSKLMMESIDKRYSDDGEHIGNKSDIMIMLDDVGQSGIRSSKQSGSQKVMEESGRDTLNSQ